MKLLGVEGNVCTFLNTCLVSAGISFFLNLSVKSKCFCLVICFPTSHQPVQASPQCAIRAFVRACVSICVPLCVSVSVCFGVSVHVCICVLMFIQIWVTA